MASYSSPYDERAELEYNSIIEPTTRLDNEYLHTGELIRRAYERFTPDDCFENRDLYETVMRDLQIRGMRARQRWQRRRGGRGARRLRNAPPPVVEPDNPPPDAQPEEPYHPPIEDREEGDVVNGEPPPHHLQIE